jgi:hypothetical protein
MLLPDPVLGGITEAVIGYVFDQGGLGDEIRRVLRRDPVRQAFKHSMRAAVEALEQQYPQWVATLFDASFFQHEGAPILAQFLLRDGCPSPSVLAIRWTESLNVRDPERHTASTRDVEPIATDFLEAMARALRAEPALQELHDSRALERLAGDITALRRRFGADAATPGTRRDYLHWLIERNLYLDPRGTYQTRRQVQVKLDNVFIALQARQEPWSGVVDWKLLDHELAELERTMAQDRLPAAEREDRRETLPNPPGGRPPLYGGQKPRRGAGTRGGGDAP